MSRNFISASLVVLALGLWMGSGELTGSQIDTDQPQAPLLNRYEPAQPTTDLNRVRVAVIAAEQRTRQLVLRGRTESKRMVEVKAEIAGSVVSRPVERGMRVARGDVLCELAVDDREVALQEARAAFTTARIEHQGTVTLREQGLVSEVTIAGSQARKEAARAHLRRQELNLAKTRIVAPFAGVVEELHMNVGDYAVTGAPCATLIDLDPMLVRADVTEAEVDSLVTGQAVAGTSSVGRDLMGLVSFVGKQSDPLTRTYPVEITVDNPDYSIRSGLTVTLNIGVETVLAHQVAPSLLSLNDAGVMGIRTLDDSNRVVFSPVDILEDGPEGVWITGLDGTVSLITVGQEYVALGEIVEPVYISGAADQVARL